MGNAFQRIIYIASNLVPLCFIVALLAALKGLIWYVPMVLCVFSVLEIVLFYIFFDFGISTLAKSTINITGIESQDAWLIGYVFSYILPFSTLSIDDYEILFVLIFLVFLVIVTLGAVFTCPSVLLFIKGYHFYKIETDSTGIKDYMLISKKKNFRNKSEVTEVKRYFEKVLIDVEGGN